MRHSCAKAAQSSRDYVNVISDDVCEDRIRNSNTILVSPACFAASMRASVTVLRQSTHVPKMSKKRAFSSFIFVMMALSQCKGEENKVK